MSFNLNERVLVNYWNGRLRRQFIEKPIIINTNTNNMNNTRVYNLPNKPNYLNCSVETQVLVYLNFHKVIENFKNITDGDLIRFLNQIVRNNRINLKIMIDYLFRF